MAEHDPAFQALSAKVRDWISNDPDPVTRDEATALLEAAVGGDTDALAQLTSAFTGRLAFGTAGLRAELGAGPARMNRVVVSHTSAGFAAYLLARAARGETESPPSIVIGYDGRVNSDVFARDTAEIMSGAGVRVTLLPEPLPTPVTAFAVRHLGVSAGVMITASHNPPRDNGYKVYLGDADDGSQIVAPADAEIAAHIDAASGLPHRELPRSGDYQIADSTVADAYVTHTARAAAGAAELLRTGTGHGGTPVDPQGFTVVYTAMHGVGSDIAQRVFATAGLPPVITVPEQDRPDGAFPTVSFPNPEEPGALDLAFRVAREHGADLVLANDPDADRLAIAAPDANAESGYRRLSGNELGLLLGWRAAERERIAAEREGRSPRGTLANTIVSSPALSAVAASYGLGYSETLSGFKWVSRVPNLIFGFEEAIGYLSFPTVVHDKDGISAAAEALAMALELHTDGRTVWQLLDDASERFGHFASSQVTVRLAGMTEVAALAERVRLAPATSLGGVAITKIRDLLQPGEAEQPANVLAYELADGSRVMIRPSGTEPKLKIYLDTFADQGTAAERRSTAEAALSKIEHAVRQYLDEVQG